MKKIVCALVVLMLAAPASADVIITCEQVPDEPNIIISYECTGDDVVRCFGLNIQLDNDETITAVECLSNDYYLNPGNFSYDGMTPSFGDPACLCDSGEPDTLPGLDSNGVTIAMCSLYASNDPDHNEPPATSNGLVKLTVSGSCCITITENGKRGGVLDEDNVDIDPTLPNDPCLCVDLCPCPGDVSDTTGFGAPDGKVDFGDLSAIVMAMITVYPAGDVTGIYDIGLPDALKCADVSDTTGFGPPDGTIDFGDLSAVVMAMIGVYPAGDVTGIYEIPCMTLP